MTQDPREREMFGLPMDEWRADGFPVHVLECTSLAGDTMRLYVNRDRDRSGGVFLVLTLGAMAGDTKEWTHAHRVCHGSAAFDGVRHLYWGDEDEDGYLCYPDFPDLIELLKLLAETFPDTSE